MRDFMPRTPSKIFSFACLSIVVTEIKSFRYGQAKLFVYMKGELEKLPAMSDTSASNDGMGSRIRSARIARGLSQPQLAEKLNVSSQAVGQWERGATHPNHERLEMLSVVLERSLIWLLTGEEATPAATEDAVRRAVEIFQSSAPRSDPAALNAGLIALSAVMTFDRLKSLGSLGSLDGQAFWREVTANYEIARSTLLEFGSFEGD